MAVKPIYNKSKKVHWIFKCNCAYMGYYYTYRRKRQCINCEEPIVSEIIICCECGKEHKYKLKKNEGGKTKCPQCVKKKQKENLEKQRASHLSTKPKPGKGVCINPFCKNPKGPGLRFFCSSCYSRYPSEVQYYYG